MNALVVRRDARQLVDGEFVFTAADFRRIAAILHADAGIALADAKATLVYSRLARRLRALGLSSFRDYCALVGAQHGVDERQRMLAALTTNVTRFFREPHHFEHLAKDVLPALVKRARSGGRVRLWSAGCATGPEPYSIAMTVLKALPEAASLDVRVLATDIDPEALETARAGVYPPTALAAIAPEHRRWLSPEGERGPDGERAWRVADEVRDLIAFRELNLVARPWPMHGRFDAVFCRNVTIYFDEPTREALAGALVERLTPGGRLYIGHSERIANPPPGLAPDGVTTYRLAPEAAR